MNGMELSAALKTMTTEQLRRVFKQAAAELKMSGKQLTAKVAFDQEQTGHSAFDDAFSWTRAAVLTVQCETRVFTKTGRKVSYVSDETFGTVRQYDETKCDWTNAFAAVDRCLDAGR